MTDFTNDLRTHGNLPAGAANALGKLADDKILVVAIDDVADVSGGGTTAAVGFQLQDVEGNDVAEVVTVRFGVYDDLGGDTAANATLNTATDGTILSGAGTAELVVRTSATGGFACTLTDASDETVYLLCSACPGSPPLDCRDSDSVEFSA